MKTLARMMARIPRTMGGIALLCSAVLAPSAQAQILSAEDLRGLSGGIQTGGLLGRTELASKPAPQIHAFLRHRIADRWEGEVSVGYGRAAGESYGTDMGLVGYKVLFSPVVHRDWRPYLYGGVGMLRYDLDKIAPSRTASVARIGWGPTLPGGLGVQIELLDEVALEVNSGYTYTFLDEINSTTTEKGKDGFWSLNLGLTVGLFGDGSRRALGR